MDDTEKKQKFLREKIMEQNYDPNEFSAYLISIKGEEGGDIDSWTLDELKQVVDKFCKEHNPSPLPNEENVTETQKETPQNVKENKEVSHEEQKKTKNQKDKKDKKDKNAPKDQRVQEEPEEISKELRSSIRVQDSTKCARCDETEISKCNNLTITVSSPEKHDGGIFSKSYITYLVTTIPFDFKVRKRFSDFEWLRATLEQQYICSVIPDLPEKNYGSRFNEEFINKRMRNLERFMQAISSDPLIRSSIMFYDFLSVESEEKWTKKKNAYSRIKPPKNVEDNKSVTGELNLDVSIEKDQYINKIKENCDANDLIIKKIMLSYKTLIENMEIVSKNMMEISQLWNQLYENSTKSLEDQRVNNTYSSLSKLMKVWGEKEKQQLDFIQIDIREYFKFIKGEFSEMKNLTSKSEVAQVNFFKAYEKLLLKKEDLFKKQDISKWEVDKNELNYKSKLLGDKNYAFSKMLPKESLAVDMLRKQYGFYLNRTIEEYHRINKLNGERHKTCLINYCQHNSGIINDLFGEFNAIISTFSLL